MQRIFRAQKMLERIEREGNSHLVNDEIRTLILNLDGKVGEDYNWQSFVHGEDVVWIEGDETHGGIYVATCDCDPV